MYHSPDTGKLYFLADWRDGTVKQVELTGGSVVTGTIVREFDVGTKVEGCVADDVLQDFYIGEEDVGIWKYGAEPGDGETRVQVDAVGSSTGLIADVEGLSMYYSCDNTGYLIASGQDNGTNMRFVVYEREDANTHLGTFRVQDSDATDGLDVTNFPLGATFPNGLLVSHDASPSPSRHRLTSFQAIADAFSLTMDTAWDPRQADSGGACGPTPTPTETLTPSADTDLLRELHGHLHADTDAHADRLRYTDGNSDVDAHPNSDDHADADDHPDADAHAHAHPHADADTHTDREPHTDADSHADRRAGPVRDTNSDFDPDRHPDKDCNLDADHRPIANADRHGHGDTSALAHATALTHPGAIGNADRGCRAGASGSRDGRLVGPELRVHLRQPDRCEWAALPRCHLHPLERRGELGVGARADVDAGESPVWGTQPEPHRGLESPGIADRRRGGDREPGRKRSNAAIAVSRFSGSSGVGNSVRANTLGVNGACSGGSDSTPYSVNLTTTVPNSLASARRRRATAATRRVPATPNAPSGPRVPAAKWSRWRWRTRRWRRPERWR